MTEVSIEQMNETIARFMGFEKIRVGYYTQRDGDIDDETDWQVENETWCDKVGITDVGIYIVDIQHDLWHAWEDVKYHSDWSWLMPVWYKFRDLQFDAEIHQYRHHDLKDIVAHAIVYANIDIAHKKLFEAIQWYNKNKEQ